MPLTPSQIPNPAVALLGIPYDANSSYLRGAADAPPRIREALFRKSSSVSE